MVLIDFSITVKSATLIFISGRGSAISSPKEEKSGFIYNLEKSVWAAQTRVHFMKVLTVYTLTSYLLTLKAKVTKSSMFLKSAESF